MVINDVHQSLRSIQQSQSSLLSFTHKFIHDPSLDRVNRVVYFRCVEQIQIPPTPKTKDDQTNKGQISKSGVGRATQLTRLFEQRCTGLRPMMKGMMRVEEHPPPRVREEEPPPHPPPRPEEPNDRPPVRLYLFMQLHCPSHPTMYQPVTSHWIPNRSQHTRSKLRRSASSTSRSRLSCLYS